MCEQHAGISNHGTLHMVIALLVYLQFHISITYFQTVPGGSVGGPHAY